ncbi:Listeria/Bacterioides repeat-containing protein, partial [Lachnospiraceae bacterium G41]
NIAKCTNSSGEASINIKPGTPDGCKLYVFNEQCNGDKKTDYSSELIDLTAPKTKPVAKNINLVVNGEADYIEGAQKSNVYFGTYPQSSDGEGGYKVEPIKWRVLSNSNGQLFMLANHGLDCKSYNETYTSITWEGSSIRTWLNETSGGFLHDAFVDIERGAIADTLVVNDDNPEHGTKGGNKTTDKIFLLSIAESEDTSFGFTGNDKSTDTRKVISTDYAKHNGAWVSGNGASDWWLRSPGYSPDNAALVLDTGNVFGTGYYVSTSKIAIRPALNLNLGSLIFTSAATGGKSSVVLGESEMEPIVNFGDGDIVEWKFTLHDTVSEGRDDLKINRIGSGDVANGGTVLFSYEDAVTGENEYLSVILVDENNNLLSYAKVADVSEEALGSAESFVRIPSTLTEGKKYKLRFLSEQCNGDYLTDYASEFAESRDIEFTVGKGTPTLDLLTISIPGLDKETWTIEYNGDKISVIVGVDDHVVGMGEPQVKYYDSEGIELENAPVDAGTYSFKIIIPEDKGYAAAELSSADWKFTIEKRTPTVDDFVVTNPKDTDYDGKGKTPSVDLIDDLSDIGKISVDYFKDGVAIEGEPKDAGEYTFKLNVDDSGKNFNSAENLSKDDWKFTIKKVNPKFTDISVSYPDSLTYDGNGKTVTPGPIEGKTGMGEITVNYYQGSDKLSEPPKKAGEYTFKLNIAGGNNFNGIENLTSDSWKFKIDKATPSTSDFKVDIPSDTTYDGNEKEVTITGLPEGIGEYSVTYYGSDEKPLTGKPKDNGKYKVKISFAEGDNFYGKDDLESDSWNFTIGKATPKASDFDVTVPDQDCTYDGNVKEASVKLNSSLDGMVTFEVVYYDDKDNKLESAPKEPGTYKVKINVAGGTNYEPVVLDNNWTFTIKTTDYEVVLELDDGTVLNNDVKTYTYGEGTKLPTAEDLKKDGHTFDGWYETKDFSGDKVTVISDKESGKKTYYAKWIINKYTVKFMNGDEVLESKEYEYGSMPSYDGAPSKDNVDNKTYYFTGWDPVITKVTGDATYTAQFGEDEIIYTITFEANGGSYDVISAITNSQFKLDTIPEPTLEGYKFLGWFTAVENGTKITTDTVFTADTTVYALWEEVTEPEEEEEEEPKKIPNYLDELFLKLNIAAELGGKQTVYWNVEDSLPYDVLHFLELHEDITLIFDYTYEDVDYSVTLGGKGFEADPKVPWAGPLYLYSVYKGKIIAKED